MGPDLARLRETRTEIAGKISNMEWTINRCTVPEAREQLQHATVVLEHALLHVQHAIEKAQMVTA